MVARLFKLKLNFNLYVVENILEDLFFCDSEVRIIVVRMGAIMDDSVHVQV